MENLFKPYNNLFKHRKLASVQKITRLSPLGKKNQEELASILGWKVIVPANQFKIGEKIIFFEIDSVLPSGKEWTKNIKKKNLHIQTVERYNIVSQGFIMKLDILLKVENYRIKIENLEEGFDLTEILEVKKYDENTEEAKKEKDKIYPKEIIEKSDEIRVQSNLYYIELFQGKEFYSSIKYDGSSSTYLIEPNTNKFKICSRNQAVNESEDNIYTEIAEKYNIKDKLVKSGRIYAIQGEIYGPKVNKNPLQVPDRRIAVFTIKNIKDNYYLGLDEMIKVCKELDLPMVQVVEEGIFNYKTIEELIAKSKGKYPGTNSPREGLVYRLRKDWNINGKRFSFKVINDDYLISKEGKK